MIASYSTRRAKALLCLALLVLLAATNGRAGVPFETWGILVQGTNCMLFASQGQENMLLVPDDYGDFQAGDTVLVSGTLIMGCETECTGTVGCIFENTIHGWHQSETYLAWGVLVQTTQCVLFAPQAQPDTLLVLDDYRDFQAGDTVLVSGILVMDCETDCPDADGCVVDNIIYGADDYIQDQVVIKILDGVGIDTIVVGFRGAVIDSIPSANTFLAAFPDSLPIVAILRGLQNIPDVVYGQPNFRAALPETYQISQAFPDQKRPPHQFGISPPSYYGDSSAYTVGSDSANLISTGENVVVAVIDNGVEFTHPLFDGAFENTGHDFVDNDNDPSEEVGNLYGHGTFVSGVVRRIAPDCRLLPLRAFDEDGLGDCYAIAQAIYHTIGDSADVINMSFGTPSANLLLEEAIAAAVNAGIAMAAAPGNDGTTTAVYPASYSGVIAVSSVDTLEYLANFSNYGEHIDVCAPGVNIYSSLAGEYKWGTWSGTSFSAPMVSGACALVLALKPWMSSVAMEEHIRLSAGTQLLWGNITPPDIRYGYGRLDAFNAVLAWNRGDVDGVDGVDIGDLTAVIGYLYLSGPPPETSLLLADVDCDGAVDISDVTKMIGYLYISGTPLGPCY